jgi:CubicO group peptidase (beta-lactamase class C family)
MFAWGSGTKPTTALLILQLVQAGKVALDDSILLHANDYLRHISGGSSDLIQLYGPQIHNLTIRNLLQMRSGLTEYDNFFVRSYQNTHRDLDLSPMWVLNTTNRSFMCAPGSCGHYSST